jgi:hypothetical protein
MKRLMTSFWNPVAQRLVQYAQTNYKNVTVVVKEYP